MQVLRSYLLSIAALSLLIKNAECMEVKQMQALDCFNKTTNIPIKIPSLKKLCINEIVTSIQKNNIDTLISKKLAEKISSLPEELQEKITTNIFCYKPGYQRSYKGDIFNYNVLLDEINNQVMFINNTDATLSLLTINGKTIKSFSWPKTYDYCQNGSLIVEQNNKYEDSIHIIKDGKKTTINGGYFPQYCRLKQILNNQHELIFWHNKKYNLCNFYQSSKPIYSNVDSIQFDNSETICMVRDGNTVTISTPKRDDRILTCVTYNWPNPNNTETIKEYRNKYETLTVFSEIEDAYLNPNGKQLLIKPKNEPAKLIRIKEKKTIFSFEKFEGAINIHTVKFSHDGNYLVLSQYIPQQGLFYHMIDTQKGKICISFSLPCHAYLSFNKKYFTLHHGDQICLIPIKNLARLNDNSTDASHVYTIEEIIKLGIGKTFNNFQCFHPNGKHIVLKPDFQWQLIDPKSEKPIFIVDKIAGHSFSKPMGKILYLQNAWHTGYEILSLRNDFTIKEYLLNRFMIEKNITEADLSQYPHMQEIYNKIDKDKLLFHCLENGKRKTNSLPQSCVII